MEDDPGAAEDERAIELSSIAAIYPELVQDAKDPYTAILELAVAPVQPLKVRFKLSGDSAPPILPIPPPSTEQDHDNSGSKPQVQPSHADSHELSHLPPLSLRITLPKGYPEAKPPMASVSVTPQWLPRDVVRSLQDDCTRLWEELGRDQVVYTYIDHLQQAAETAFGLASNDEQEVQFPSELKLALLDFDLKTKRDHFENETFDCGICLEPKKGLHCHRLLLCGHVFCVACLQDFYQNCIREGDVDNVKCLSPDCGKDETGANGRSVKRQKHDRTLNPSELLQIPIEQDLVQRYVRLKRKKELEADKDTIYCPRQWCQGAARSKKHPKPIDPMNDVVDPDSESEEEATSKKPPQKVQEKKPEDIPMAQRLAVCEDCDFAFCSVCRRGWHGELADCNPRREAELKAEEQASLDYLQRYSTACPTCNAPSQKTMGCNHMVCFRCKTHFCYLCSSYLMPDNPYRHFNTPKSLCYMRLWELEGGDGDDVGIGYAGGHGVADGEPEDWPSDSDSDLDDDDFDHLGDEDPLFGEEDSTDDEEPAPDQRRNMHIEIVNFARQGVQNQRIPLPDRPRVAVPPPAPAPPQRERGPQEGDRQRAIQNGAHRAVRGAPVPHHDDDGGGRPMVRARPAPGQGNGFGAQQPAPVRAMGLERFLQLALQDQEDEWDSDELEELEDGDEFGPPPAPRRERR